jgi:hypothetical protein
MSKLESYGSEVVVVKTIKSNWEGLFWRFAPASEADVEIFISRDIDSRLNEREQAAVEEWLSSDKPIHCMRDHIEHNVPILGGMWGCRKGVFHNMKQMISDWGKCDYKGSDQDFLRTVVWENLKHLVLAHDKFHNGFSVEQIVSDPKEYIKQREEYNDFRNRSMEAKKTFIAERFVQGISPSKEELDKLFPELEELKPIRYNENNQIVFDYVYNPLKLFGKHDVRPFPPHKEMKHGSHVGEIIEEVI